MLLAMSSFPKWRAFEYGMTEALNNEHEEMLSVWQASSLTSNTTGKEEKKSFSYYFHLTMKCSSQMKGD